MSFVQEHTNDDVHDYRDVGGRATQEQLPRMYGMSRVHGAQDRRFTGGIRGRTGNVTIVRIDVHG